VVFLTTQKIPALSLAVNPTAGKPATDAATRRRRTGGCGNVVELVDSKIPPFLLVFFTKNPPPFVGDHISSSG